MNAVSRNIPKQRKGTRSDTSYTVNSRNDKDAARLFKKAKHKLLSVNQWKSYAGKSSADFILTDETGKQLSGDARTGAFIRIHLPVAEKNVFDWVAVEEIEIDESSAEKQWIIMKVRPAPHPGTGDTPDHFFADSATSNFIVERNLRKVTAAVRGRNELPNTKQKDLFKKIRNSIIALFAMSGLNKPQWKALCKGLLKEN